MILTPAWVLALTTRSASGPVEAALAGALDLAPLEERLLPVEADVGDEFEVAAGGVGVTPQEDAHAEVGAAHGDGRGARGGASQRLVRPGAGAGAARRRLWAFAPKTHRRTWLPGANGQWRPP